MLLACMKQHWTTPYSSMCCVNGPQKCNVDQNNQVLKENINKKHNSNHKEDKIMYIQMIYSLVSYAYAVKLWRKLKEYSQNCFSLMGGGWDVIREAQKGIF